MMMMMMMISSRFAQISRLFTIIYVSDENKTKSKTSFFCPWGASKPRPWSRGLHHWYLLHVLC